MQYEVQANRPFRMQLDPTSSKPWLVPAIFGLLGLVFIVLSVYLLFKSASLERRGIKTTAQVTEVDSRVSRDSEGRQTTSYSSTLVFQDTHGQRQSLKASGDLGKGKQVRVLYDPEDPSNALVDSAMQKWIGPGIFLTVGLVLLSIAVFIFVQIQQRKAEVAWLRLHAQRRTGTVVGVNSHEIRNHGRRRNGFRSGYRRSISYEVVCEAEDLASGGKRQYISHRMDRPPQVGIGAMVEVLIDPSDSDNYFIELS